MTDLKHFFHFLPPEIQERGRSLFFYTRPPSSEILLSFVFEGLTLGISFFSNLTFVSFTTICK